MAYLIHYTLVVKKKAMNEYRNGKEKINSNFEADDAIFRA